MRILIVRNDASSYMDVKHNTYNIQEVGLARALVKLGYSCDIVFWSRKKEKLQLKCENGVINIIYLTGRRIIKDSLFTGLETIIPDYDLIQLSEYNQLQSWVFANKFPEKTVLYHGPYYSDFNKRYNIQCKIFDRLFLPQYKKNQITLITKSKMAEEFLRDKGLSNVTTIGVGIDLQAFASDVSAVPEVVKSLEKKDDTINILYVGRIQPRRNIIFIYKVLSKLKECGYKVKLVLVGSGERDYVSMCEKEEQKLSIKDEIIKIDKLEQKYLPLVYKKCDFFFLPTQYEIFGMVLLEAMYYGLPCLTTENGGSDMLINNGENGFVIPLDENQWMDCVSNLWKDKVRLRRISDSAHKTITDEFTWDALAPKFVDVYRKVIKE